MAVMNPYNYNKPAVKVRLNNKAQAKSYTNVKQLNQQQDAYLEQRVMTAKPEELTLMLYEGMIKFIKMGRLYNEQGEIEKTNHSLVKAQAIIIELQSTLDMDYDISQSLDSLYDFMYNRLVDGNLNKDDQAMSDALEIAVEMRDTWKEAMALL